MFKRSSYVRRPRVRRRATALRRRRPVAKSLAPRTRKAVATIAKRIVSRSHETKYISREVPSLTNIYGDTLPSGAGAVPQLFTALPQLGEGSTSYERDGLKVTPVKHRTELLFGFNQRSLLIPPGGANPVPIAQAGWDVTVHIWYGYIKRFKNVTDVLDDAPTILNNMFDGIETIRQRFTGTVIDTNLELNKEFVGMKHKKIRLYKNAGLANVGDATSPSLSTPMSEAKKVVLAWSPPASMLFNTEGDLFPENYAPFYVVGYHHNDFTLASSIVNDGATSNLLKIPALQMWATDKLWFKDA